MTDTKSSVRLDPVEQAVADIAAGKAVIVVDDEDRENEGDIIFAAAKATPELMAFTIRHSSGVICVPMPGDMLERLEIPLMTPHNKDKLRTAYTISVDARDGVSTGISAADRAHTARTLADSATEPWELTRPGHVFPLRYRDGGAIAPRWATNAERLQLLVLGVVGYAAAYVVLTQVLGSWGPTTEAWILAGSMLATYGMARGWVEFWLVWVAVDAVGVTTLVHAGWRSR